MSHKHRTALLATALLAPYTIVLAADNEVYYWVDANGVANYSQWAPPESMAGVSTKVLQDAAPPARGTDEDLYAVEATAEQMDAVWADIRQRRMDQRERQSQAAPQTVVVQQPEPYYVFPGSYAMPGRGPDRWPDHRPDRPRPVERPPGNLVLKPRN